MSEFTDVLRAEAAQLADQYLPSPEEVRGFIGALAQHVADLEQQLLDKLGDKPAAPAAPAVPDPKQQELDAARAELEAAQAKVAQLTQAG